MISPSAADFLEHHLTADGSLFCFYSEEIDAVETCSFERQKFGACSNVAIALVHHRLTIDGPQRHQRMFCRCGEGQSYAVAVDEQQVVVGCGDVVDARGSPFHTVLGSSPYVNLSVAESECCRPVLIARSLSLPSLSPPPSVLRE